ncbi:MAG: DUF2782 domain-containing protein [Pseudomonadota bacterium]|nr:DUF2782 domain-containing protein [Pseudomonadota bacterium]
MRTLLALVLLAAALDVASQSAARARPPGTMPLDEPPPPPAMVESDPALEPQVTIRREGEQTVQEYRVKGKLYMQRVTPKNGRPYVLMDHKGDGTFSKQDNTLDNGVRVPQWVLLEF